MKKKSKTIYLFDTYTREKKRFIPLNPGKVTMYSCGPTVYDYPHIGNLRAYVFVDILKRMFEFNGYEVANVVNITDVGHLVSDADEGEDKIEASAKKQKKSVFEIADFFTRIFKENLDSLNIELPTIFCKATDHIPDQINLIKRIEILGYTYRISDGIYFDTSMVKNYGYLARLDVSGIEPGARVELNREKRNSTDFALWKFSPKNQKRQMEWDSPWGRGFPGWHIECSAMAMKHLGETIDIHTGGIDHIPVHHTNEIAQSETATGKQFARYWMHVSFLSVDGGKMSKSLGNFFTLEHILNKGFDPSSFRYLLLTAKYSANLNFTWNSLMASQKALFSLRDKICDLENGAVEANQSLLEKFRGFINNDLNTPKALAFVWEVITMSIPAAVKRATIAEFDRVLGLNLLIKIKKDIPENIKLLAQKRDVLRKNRRWKEADQVRIEIESMGYKLKDTKDGFIFGD